MSSILNALDMSLDAIIAKKKESSSGPKKNAAIRNKKSKNIDKLKSAKPERKRVMQKPYGRKNEVQEKRGKSILSRVGNPKSTIVVKNLKYDILEDELKELFSTVGKVMSTKIIYDASGRSTGVAHISFPKAFLANKAIEQYNGRTLDGRPMDIAVVGEEEVKGQKGKKALFGTALRNNENKTFNRKPRKNARQVSNAMEE